MIVQASLPEKLLESVLLKRRTAEQLHKEDKECRHKNKQDCIKKPDSPIGFKERTGDMLIQGITLVPDCR